MIGIDVGGANLKVVDERGVHIHPCPLWKQAPLEALLRKHPSDQAFVVMTGELADCFASKKEGIQWIVSTVKGVYPHAQFYGVDGLFHEDAVPALAAANWLVSAAYLQSHYPNQLLMDMGSTTTDLIPLGDLDCLKGMTDLQRLQKGYLVYHGFLRTSIPMFVQELRVNGHSTPLSREHFAINADAHLLLGHIGPSDYTCDTPDGAPATPTSSVRRLARLVCADPEEVGGEKGVREIAAEICQIEYEQIARAVRSVGEREGTEGILCAGIGGRYFAPLLGGFDLASALGQGADALPAYAVREVGRRTAG